MAARNTIQLTRAEFLEELEKTKTPECPRGDARKVRAKYRLWARAELAPEFKEDLSYRESLNRQFRLDHIRRIRSIPGMFQSILDTRRKWREDPEAYKAHQAKIAERRKAWKERMGR